MIHLYAQFPLVQILTTLNVSDITAVFLTVTMFVNVNKISFIHNL